jgi:hypothetical protein
LVHACTKCNADDQNYDYPQAKEAQAPWFSPPAVPYFYPPVYYSQNIEAPGPYFEFYPPRQPVITSTSTITSQESDTPEGQINIPRDIEDTDAASVLLSLSRTSTTRVKVVQYMILVNYRGILL